MIGAMRRPDSMMNTGMAGGDYQKPKPTGCSDHAVSDALLPSYTIATAPILLLGKAAP